MDFALQGSYNYVYLAISELYVELFSSLANELNLFRVYMKVSYMSIYLWSGVKFQLFRWHVLLLLRAKNGV